MSSWVTGHWSCYSPQADTAIKAMVNQLCDVVAEGRTNFTPPVASSRDDLDLVARRRVDEGADRAPDETEYACAVARETPSPRPRTPRAAPGALTMNVTPMRSG